MSLYAVEPEEMIFWTFRTGERGIVRMDVTSNIAVNTYIFDFDDWDEDAKLDELPYFGRIRRKLEHEHKFRVDPRQRLVAVVWNPSKETAAVDAQVWSK